MAKKRVGVVASARLLKNQYNITTEYARGHLNLHYWLNEILDEIGRKYPHLFGLITLSPEKMGVLVCLVRDILENELNQLFGRISTPKRWVVGAIHGIDLPAPMSPEDEFYERDFSWDVDFTALIPKLLNLAIVKRAPIGSHFRRISERVSILFKGDKLSLLYGSDAKSVSCRQIVNKSPCYIEDLDEWGVWHLMSDVMNSGRHCDCTPIPESLMNAFRKAFNEDDLEGAHWAFRRVMLTNIRLDRNTICSESVETWGNGKITDEWLYDSDMYERAKRKGELDEVCVRRHILINAIREFEFRAESVEKFVTTVVSTMEDEVSRDWDEQDMESQDELVPDFDSQQGSLEKSRYLLEVLKKDRLWLIDYLSN